VEYSEGIFVGYRGYEKNGVKPQFPFGFGLSYTTFGYSDLRVESPEKSSGAVVEVSFQVENTGDREGAEIAEVYVGDPQNGPPRPVKELKGFVKIDLKPGEKKRVNVQLDRRSFSYYDPDKHAWYAPPGDYGVLVGSSSADIRLKGNYILPRQ